jgi:hypothetical protein
LEPLWFGPLDFEDLIPTVVRGFCDLLPIILLNYMEKRFVLPHVHNMDILWT